MSSKRARGPFAKVKCGNVTIPIYRVENKGYVEFRVLWYEGSGDERKRRQKAFANENEARRHAATIHNAASVDSKAITLVDHARFVYENALNALADLGTPLNDAAKAYAEAVKRLGAVPLAEAVSFYVKHNCGLESRTVSEVVTELIDAKRKPSANKKPASAKYLADLESRLGRFEDAFHCNIGDVQPKDVEGFLGALNVTGRTWFNYARLIRTLFNFAQAKKYIPANIDPMDGIDIEFDDDSEIEIFTPEELKKLFSVARPEVIPFLAIAAFAGVRHAELGRLEWKHISDTHIEITAKGAKTRSRRVIPIQANLAQWLAPYRQQSGPVVSFANMSKQLLWLSEDAKVEWRHNGLRHSYISYRLAKTNDENLVAVEAGNSPTMIQHHYRQIKDHTGRVITPELANAWFSIAPEQASNVLPLRVVNE